jgi:hypothetical protein
VTRTFRDHVATILVNTAYVASGSATRWLASHQSSPALMVVLFLTPGDAVGPVFAPTGPTGVCLII